MAEKLWAAALVFVLAPLHRLADRLVCSKVRAGLGVRKAVVSGGGALAPHLDDWYEAVGVTVRRPPHESHPAARPRD